MMPGSVGGVDLDCFFVSTFQIFEDTVHSLVCIIAECNLNPLPGRAIRRKFQELACQMLYVVDIVTFTLCHIGGNRRLIVRGC